MKLCLSLFLYAFIPLLSSAQAPSVEIWDKRFGGSNYDGLAAFQQTTDGGYILGGFSNSMVSGDKTQPDWDNSMSTWDYWVVKIDSVGNKEWDKRFGGTSEDNIHTIKQTKDNGYILGGVSGSGVGGDKTQPGWGGFDYWVVKIDGNGNKEWDKRYGYNKDEYMETVQQTTDGGYILGGASSSGVGGDKSQPNWDPHNFDADYWVIKTDSFGNKQWDKRFGGIEHDQMSSIAQTTDGGYILGGIAQSDSSGDISQHRKGGADYWIVKIDASGTKEWDRRFGGSSDNAFWELQQTADGGYILGGYSGSDSSGDKTQDTQGNFDYDYWMVKIDASGNKQWDKDFGGTGNEQLDHIEQTSDKGYLLSGSSSSLHIGGDKTENNLGYNQIWIVKTDSIGSIQWDKTIFTPGFNAGGYAIEIAGGCYVVALSSDGGAGGYRTQPNWDTSDSTDDIWIGNFCFTGIPEGTENLTDKVKLSIYPNPFTSELDISIAKTDIHKTTFTITNMLGQPVYSQQETNLSPTYTKMLDLSYLPNGLYVVEIVANGERVVRRVVKQ